MTAKSARTLRRQPKTLNNLKAEWGNCASDRRQILNLSLVAQTPKFESPWMERLVGNWNASGIFTASTGSYVNVTDGSDISLDWIRVEFLVRAGRETTGRTRLGILSQRARLLGIPLALLLRRSTQLSLGLTIVRLPSNRP